MLDKERIYTKIDALNEYLVGLEEIRPSTFEEYQNSMTTMRACERLLQMSIETLIDICQIIAANLTVGLPSDEDALLEKLEKKKVISPSLKKLLHEMKGFRNILVHKYGEVKDEEVFENLSNLSDFDKFKREIVQFIADYEHKLKKK